MFKLLFRLALLLVIVAAVVYFFGGGSPAESRQSLLDQFTLLEQRLVDEDVRADSVSGWSIHEHVEHIVLAAEAMLGMIETGAVPADATGTSLIGQLVLKTGYIPRGRGDAPDTTVPGKLAPTALRGRLELLATRVRALEAEALEADERIVGNHQVFGGFTAAQWLRFMAVHGNHHAKIISDIGVAG
jgi:hypothetical protein